MKTLKSIKIMPLALAVVFNACSSDEKEEPKPQSAQLSISTSIQTKAVITEFAAGDKMNLYVKSESSVTSADKVANISASYENSKWSISPTVELNEGEKAYLFAFYPYSANLTKPEAIPVDITAQTDYLYSGNAVSVSHSSPQGILKMQHASSILAFNISKGRYEGAGELSSIKIADIPVKGTLNIASGIINSTEKGDYTITANKQIEDAEWTKDLPQMFCLPFKSSGQDIAAVFLTDGKECNINLPKIDIEAGMKYIFHLVITDNGMTVLAGLTEKISLNKEGTPLQPGEYSLLQVDYSGKSVSAPILSGIGNVTGMVDWGDNSTEAYSTPLTHTYSAEAVHSVTIEAWGASQMEIADLVNVESVDLSDF